MLLDINSSSGVKCEVRVPDTAKLTLEGTNGKVEVSQPHFGFDINLVNGHVEVGPDESEKYRFDVSVQNGSMDSFESSNDAKAHKIAIHVVNGKVSNQN